MAATFGEKFEEALAARRELDPDFGFHTLAKQLAKGDKRQAEIIRRRLYKYRPRKPGSGGATVTPTDSTRWEIEEALGLDRDALKPDAVAASNDLVADLFHALDRYVDHKFRTAAVPS